MADERLRVLLEVNVGGTQDITGLRESMETLDRSVTGLQGKFSGFGSSVGNTRTQFRGLGSEVDSLAAKLQKLDIGKSLQGVSTTTAGISSGMQSIGIAATAAGIPIGLLAKDSLSTFGKFETQLNKNTALLGGTKQDFNELKNLAFSLSKTTLFDAQSIAAGQESLAASGMSLKEIKDSMGTVALMSQATGEGITGMSDILVNVMSEFGATSEQAGQYGDVLAKAANESTASITDMGEALKYAGNMSKITHKDVNEMGASLMVMANNGIKGTMAGTGLVEIFRSLSKLSPKSKKALAEYGLTPEDIDPATHSMEQLLETFNKANLSNADLFTIFGSEAAPKISALISDQGLKDYKEALNSLKNESKGALQEFADSQVDGLTMAMHQIGNAMDEVKMGIGEGLKPIVQDISAWLNENGDTLQTFSKNAIAGVKPLVTEFLDIIKSVMTWFNSLPDDMQSKIAGITGMGAALAAIGGPLLLLGSLPVSALSKVTGVLASLFATGGLMGGTAAAGGITSVVSSLTALAGIQPIKIAQYLTPIGPAASTAAGEVGILSSSIAALGGPVTAGALIAVSAGLLAYTTNFGDFRDNVNSIISDLGSAAENISTGKYEEAGRNCANAFGDGLETVTDLVGGVVKSIPGAISGAGEFVNGANQAGHEFGVGIGKGAVEGVSSMSGTVADAIRLITSENAAKNEIPAAIRGWFSGFTLDAEGASLGQTLLNGFLGVNFSPLTEVISGAISGAADTGIGLIKKKLAEINNISLDQLNATLKEHGIVGNTLANAGNPKTSDSGYSAYQKGIAYAIQQGALQGITENASIQDYWENRASHSGGYGSPGSVVKGTKSDPIYTEAVSTGTQSAGVYSGTDIDAIAKAKGWDASTVQALVNKGANFDSIIASSKAAAEETDSSTESTKKATKASSDLKNSFSSLQDAMDASAEAGKTHFTYDGVKYGTEWDSEGNYSYQSQDLASEAARKKEKLANAATEKTSKLADSAYDSYMGYLDTYDEAIKSAEVALQNKLKYVDPSSKTAATQRSKAQDAYDERVRKAQESFVDNVTNLNQKKGSDYSTNPADRVSVQSSPGGISKTDLQITQTGKVVDQMGPVFARVGNSSGIATARITQTDNSIRAVTSTFRNLQDRETTLQNNLESGSITRDQYIEGMKELSRQYDIISRSTNQLTGTEKEATENWQRRVENLVNHYNAGLVPADDFISKLKELGDTWLGTGQVLDSLINKAEGYSTNADGSVNLADKASSDLAGTAAIPAFKEIADYYQQMYKDGDASGFVQTLQTGMQQVFLKDLEIGKQQGKTFEDSMDYAVTSMKGKFLETMGMEMPYRGSWEYDSKVRDESALSYGGSLNKIMDAWLPSLTQTAKDIYSGKASVTGGGNYSGSGKAGDMTQNYGFAWGNTGDIKLFGDSLSSVSGKAKSFSDILSSFGLNADQASIMQQKYNSIAKDGIAYNGEAVDYLARYNSLTQQSTQYTQANIGQTQGMLQAIIQSGQAQQAYSQYMQDGSLSAKEAADMNSRLADITRILGDAGITATGGVSGLPPALQSLASYAQSAANMINNAIANANAAVASAQSYIQSVRDLSSQYQSQAGAKSSLADKYNITVSGNTFGSTTTAGKIVSDILNGTRAAGY